MSENETESDDIIVTHTRFRKTDTDTGGEAHMFWTVQVPAGAPDPFAQYGGNETPEVARFEMIDGNVYVTLPGYSFKIRIAAVQWARMNDLARGELIKVLSEYKDSPDLVATFNDAQADGVREIEIRFDVEIDRGDGTIEQWESDTDFGTILIINPLNADNTVDTSRVDRVVIIINANVFPSPDGSYPMAKNTQGELEMVTFGTALVHELRHMYYAVGYSGTVQQEENLVRSDADRMIDDIFSTPGETERSPQSYLNSQTFIGSRNNDDALGTAGADVMSGLTGNDTLSGGAGDDLIMGGAGMDRLSGGTGSNYVLGGLDADTYVPEAGVTAEVVSEMGGVDRIDLARISINDIQVARYGDALTITYNTAAGSETVQVQNHWVEGGKVEQFTFAEGTFAASYIEELAGSGPGGVCYDGPNPVICGPYGLPVVLDLDGDGLELIAMRDSKARFDIDGDGARERIGWVGPDDGLLALDRNGNGRIDDFSEISFLQDFLGAGSDLEGLFAYDSDGDGYLTGADERFSEFLVWRDINGNGHSEKKELFTLDELGIVSISLERKNIVGLDVGADRNQVLATSSFQIADGRTFQVGDVALFSNLTDCGCHVSMTPHLERVEPE